MQTLYNRKFRSFFSCILLFVMMTVFTTGCNNTKKESPSEIEKEESLSADSSVLGEGKKQFPFIVVDQEGKETRFEIHTEKETVGEALSELGLIAGEESEYGLYVKTVNHITADYDKDGVYWAFYINDEYAQTGVDSTEITEGNTYSFKIE